MTSSNRAQTVQFLINCLRAFLNPEDASSLKTFQKDSVDWSALLELASYHKVVPLLYRSLQSISPQMVPEPVLTQIKAHLRSTLARNLFLTRELMRLLKHLEINGIQAIPYKGPILAYLLYGDLALRESIDIDILIKREDYLSAKRLLLSLGYKPIYPLTRRQEKIYLNSTNQAVFTLMRNAVMVTVELHYDIRCRDLPFHPDIEGMLERCKRVSIAGTEAATFSPEDLLLFLCAHGSQHMWRCLQWLCDVARLVRIHATTMDWDRVMEQAENGGGKRMLFLGIFLINDILGAPIPHEILERIKQDPLTVKLAGQVKQRLLSRSLIVPGTWGKMMFKSQLRGQNELDCFLYFIRDFFRVITTPTPVDWMSIPLPDTFFPLYYFLRPVRLTGKYGLRAVKHIYNPCKGK